MTKQQEQGNNHPELAIGKPGLGKLNGNDDISVVATVRLVAKHETPLKPLSGWMVRIIAEPLHLSVEAQTDKQGFAALECTLSAKDRKKLESQLCHISVYDEWGHAVSIVPD